MLNQKTQDHFNKIASTWKEKGWVQSSKLNHAIKKFIQNAEEKIQLDRKKHKSMLYLGIGTGTLFEYLQDYRIAGVDQASSMLEQCPEGIIQILSQAENLPFLMQNQFNVGFFRNLLKHCREPVETIQEVYKKIKNDYILVGCESIVYDKDDISVPTELVRLTDPQHPPFLTLEQSLLYFKKAGFKNISYEIFPFRDQWLKKWLNAEQASKEIQSSVLNLYQNNQKFREKYKVTIHKDGDITSTVPWLMITAKK